MIGDGDEGLDDNRLMDTPGNRMGCRVIMMLTSRVCRIFYLKQNAWIFFYVTGAQPEVSFDAPSAARTIMPDCEKVNQLNEFFDAHWYIRENVPAEEDSLISRFFIRCDRKDIHAGR